MAIHFWLLLLGGLALTTSFLTGWLRRGSVTSFAVYLIAGVLVGPGVFKLASVSLTDGNVHWLRGLSEAAIVVSVFMAGLKLRLGFRHGAWTVALRLALLGTLLTAALVCAMGVWILHWPLAWSLALAAMISPTDPVLASMVTVDDARDDNAVRVALSGEAGLNDATALPLLILGLNLIGANATPGLLAHWLLLEVVWSFAAGAAIGLLGGWGLGLIGTHLRHVTKEVAPSDFLAVGIMLVVYASAELVHASGFLAAFAAGIGLRRVELRVISHTDGENQDDPLAAQPAELGINPNDRSNAHIEHARHSVGWVVSDALSFGDTVERLIASMLVLFVGIVAIPALSWIGVGIAVATMFLVRPAAVLLSTLGSEVPQPRRWLLGWFGIRGMGSLNYLAFGLLHGLKGALAANLAAVVITTVVVSVLLHGISVAPLMRWHARSTQH